MSRPKHFEDPNVHDPLSEPTFNRRLWAAYLAAGFDRASWSRALDCSYVQCSAYDHGKSQISFPRAVRAAELVGFTLDELVYGKAGRPRLAAVESSLGEQAIADLFDVLRVDDDTAAAWATFRASTVGVMQRATRTYVVTWINTYVKHRSGKVIPDARAINQARREADNERAKRDAEDAGRLQVNRAKRLAEPVTRNKRVRRPLPRLPTAPPSARGQ